MPGKGGFMCFYAPKVSQAQFHSQIPFVIIPGNWTCFGN
ncbi:hypothetical protein ADICYQ_1086 [Cyclobacterium qasimii M12-11B]|uniref:Uncharacterized protein n=1 Tax=Cyclobacterium qasimii M12-11B TaxID=641524 RepID=S7VL60_9BACT|nr:hypothetical protein ADICYQ_1086 [Cyclobacterium qasimii M12-11B]